MTDSNNPYRKRVKTFNVPGHVHFLTFSCYRKLPLLTNELWREWLALGVRRACIQHNYALWAYVFMPEHVHLLVHPRNEKYDLSKFRQSLKQGVSQRIIHSLQKNRAPLLEKLRVQERPGKWCYRFWQEGPGYDKNIWDMETAVEKANYCHSNPVARQLAQSPDKWKWSSYRWLHLNDKNDAPLPLDDWM